MDIDYMAIIGMIVAFLGWGAYYLHVRKLKDAIVELFDRVNRANADGKVTQEEFDIIMDQIATVMKAGKVVVDDIEAIGRQIDKLLKRKQ